MRLHTQSTGAGAALALAASAWAGPGLAISWWTIECGGGTSSAGPLVLSGTVGQFDASTTFTGGSLRLTGGFWAGLTVTSCGPADVGKTGGVPGPDGVLDNNDFVVFIDYFFTNNPIADVGQAGGVPGADGQWNNNDFVVFIDFFFAGCP
ncbi:MAG TPA: GC-type dockerin domain-anchored protein [Phycisphaerales bacterium]|nr:GC-type dockerin domain-anchored protein [Phycisphaerales bacterium]